MRAVKLILVCGVLGGQLLIANGQSPNGAAAPQPALRPEITLAKANLPYSTKLAIFQLLVDSNDISQENRDRFMQAAVEIPRVATGVDPFVLVKSAGGLDCDGAHNHCIWGFVLHGAKPRLVLETMGFDSSTSKKTTIHSKYPEVTVTSRGVGAEYVAVTYRFIDGKFSAVECGPFDAETGKVTMGPCSN
jgi:hypothetical protein